MDYNSKLIQQLNTISFLTRRLSRFLVFLGCVCGFVLLFWTVGLKLNDQSPDPVFILAHSFLALIFVSSSFFLSHLSKNLDGYLRSGNPYFLFKTFRFQKHFYVNLFLSLIFVAGGLALLVLKYI